MMDTQDMHVHMNTRTFYHISNVKIHAWSDRTSFVILWDGFEKILLGLSGEVVNNKIGNESMHNCTLAAGCLEHVATVDDPGRGFDASCKA